MSEPAPPEARRAPARFGPFEVVAEIGRGGMGVVYCVRHSETGRLCALKVMSSGVRDTLHDQEQ
jgi:serine/threonine protein kinase